MRIPARLRYRIAGGDIKWFYQLYRWESFLRDQVGYDLKDAGEATGLPTFEGAPEAPRLLAPPADDASRRLGGKQVQQPDEHGVVHLGAGC